MHDSSPPDLYYYRFGRLLFRFLDRKRLIMRVKNVPSADESRFLEHSDLLNCLLEPAFYLFPSYDYLIIAVYLFTGKLFALFQSTAQLARRF